jgi:hypothetical protein
MYIDYIATKLAPSSEGGEEEEGEHYYLPDELNPTKPIPEDLDEVMEQDYAPKHCMFCRLQRRGRFSLNVMVNISLY